MQACRISIAEAHPSQVVKALLDPRSHFGAFLLADSSCVLLSLSSPESQHRLSIPPPCTDVCFLRVQARQHGAIIPLPGSPSASSSSKGSLGMSRAPSAGLREQANAKGKLAGVSGVALDGEEARVNIKTGSGNKAGGEQQEKQLGQIRMGCDSKFGVAPRARGSRYKAGDAGNTRDDLFILSAMPGKGGSWTYLKAWNCDQQEFSPTMIGLSGWHYQDSYPKARHLMQRDRSAEKLTIARLDVPHGLAVKIAATINVVVLYSPSVGKVWTMAAKYCRVKESEPKASTAGVFGSSGISERSGEIPGRGGSGCRPRSWGSTGLKDGCREGREYRQSRLCLIKCAVVDCNGPVYSLHLSLQHLFVGQMGGLRVWPLRPLIKNIRLPNRKETTEEKADFSDASKDDLSFKHCAAISATDSGKSGQQISKVVEKESAFDGHKKSGPLAISTVISRENAQGINDNARSLSMTVLENGCVERLCEVKKMGDSWKSKVYPGRSSSSCGKSCTCNRGSVCMKQEGEPVEGGVLKEGSQEVLVEKEFGRWDNAEIQGSAALTSQANDLKVHSELINNYKRSEQQSGLEYVWKVAGPQARNGLLFHEVYSMEDWHSQRQLSQSSTLSCCCCSSSSLSQSPLSSSHSGVAATTAFSTLPGSFLPSTCCCFTPIVPSKVSFPAYSSACLGGCSLLGVKTSDNSESPWDHLKTVSKDREGFISILVPFPRGTEQHEPWQLEPVRTKSQQAVGIHTLSEREFLVLDSLGKLHLLTLEHSMAAGKVLRGGGGSGDVSMKALNCSMRVKMLAVLPKSLQNIGASESAGSYKLWISDGGYSIHVVVFPHAHVPQEGDHGEEPRNISVTQMMFTSERVCALAASSMDTMVAFTQGSIVAYTVTGT